MKVDFFSSDMHYWHYNCIKYCNRPFTSVEEMNAAMINNWNSVVKPEHRVLILGDFSFAKTQDTTDILKQLNGHKTLLMGNHDWKWTRTKYLKCGMDEVIRDSWVQTEIEGLGPVTISHFPYSEPGTTQDQRYLDKRPQNYGGWLLCGHVHHHWKTRNKMINVGVDVWDFTPVALDQIKELMK